MDKISQILEGLRERFSSPLIFSFLVSWSIFNWEVIVGLLWFDSSANPTGYKSLINFITENTNEPRSFRWPLCAAVAYTIVSPVLSNAIKAFQTWNTKWGEKWNLQISKGSKVPIEKYLALKSNLDERSKILENIIEDEKGIQNKLHVTETALLDARNELNKRSEELSTLRAVADNYNNISILNGKWIKEKRIGTKVVRENIEIFSNNIYLHQGVERIDKYSIHHFHMNIATGETHFALFEKVQAGAFYSFNSLNFQHNQFVGMEYRNDSAVQVTYSKSEQASKQIAKTST